MDHGGVRFPMYVLLILKEYLLTHGAGYYPWLVFLIPHLTLVGIIFAPYPYPRPTTHVPPNQAPPSDSVNCKHTCKLSKTLGLSSGHARPRPAVHPASPALPRPLPQRPTREDV